ncbi:shikimate dehydrogenase [Altererythrobacter sp. Root672]|nr:shikimate dehydrogenase [Altererythrobacter sp. Root672]
MPEFGSPEQVLVGLLGRDIQLSRSPQMHEDEASAQGIPLVYKLFDFAALGMTEQDLPVFLETLQASGFSGINVTHPYKQAVIPLLDELSSGAERVGAVNTIAFRNGKRLGFNTDVTGFAESFRNGLPSAGVKVVFQAGAGGAGAATAYAMLEMGANTVILHDPQETRAEQLCEALRHAFGIERARVSGDIRADVSQADGIINATPVGMAGYPGTPIPVDLLRPDHWVSDIVYFPLETMLLQKASAIGCAVLDGGGMAVFQAAGAFEIFTGHKADGSRMRERFLAIR